VKDGVKMNCIPYINDLLIEIDTLNKLNSDGKLNSLIEKKEKLLQKCKNNLTKLSDNKIEYRLYLKIISGTNPSKAVEEIARENYINDIYPSSIASIWRIYRNLKKNIEI
jgi:hypothetical protein